MKKMTENRQPFEKMCLVCGAIFVGYGSSRCPKCNSRYKVLQAAERRRTRRELLLEKNDELLKEGKRVCSKCHRVRFVSEFRTSQPHRQGKLNTICDHCLTRMYENPHRKEMGFCGNFWRKKAYCVNTMGRVRLAKLAGKKPADISLTELEWECKPQDLAELLDKQDGKCAYCHVELTPSNVQVDHMVPLSRSGPNTLDNLALACKDCNMIKLTRTKDEFLAFMKEYCSRFNS